MVEQKPSLDRCKRLFYSSRSWKTLLDRQDLDQTGRQRGPRCLCNTKLNISRTHFQRFDSVSHYACDPNIVLSGFLTTFTVTIIVKDDLYGFLLHVFTTNANRISVCDFLHRCLIVYGSHYLHNELLVLTINIVVLENRIFLFIKSNRNCWYHSETDNSSSNIIGPSPFPYTTTKTTTTDINQIRSDAAITTLNPTITSTTSSAPTIIIFNDIKVLTFYPPHTFSCRGVRVVLFGFIYIAADVTNHWQWLLLLSSKCPRFCRSITTAGVIYPF